MIEPRIEPVLGVNMQVVRLTPRALAELVAAPGEGLSLGAGCDALRLSGPGAVEGVVEDEAGALRHITWRPERQDVMDWIRLRFVHVHRVSVLPGESCDLAFPLGVDLSTLAV